MKHKILFLVMGLVVGVAVGAGVMLATQNQPEVDRATSLTGPVKYNCELSGGEFVDGECECPIEPSQTQEMMYDESTGFCQTTAGGPGGDAFQASAGLPYGPYKHYGRIVSHYCEKSGGTMLSGATCQCPDGEVYDKFTGVCEVGEKVADHCSKQPTFTDAGSPVYPTKPEYADLGYMGQLFTASECDEERMENIFGVENSVYTLGSTLTLKVAPSSALRSVLLDVGYACAEKPCTEWVNRDESIGVDELLELKPYVDQIQSSDCIHCG